MFNTNANAFIGAIKASEPDKNAPPKPLLSGRIRARAETVKAAEPPREDKPVPVKPPYTAIHGGVSTHAVTLNSLQPYREDPTAWDVLAFPHIKLTGQFSQYVLPNPQLKISDYFQNPDIEFDDQCLIGKQGPHMPNAGDWNTYALRCRVQIAISDGSAGAMTNEQLSEILSQQTNLGYSIYVPIVGAGAFANNSLTATSVGTIKRNVVMQNADGSSRLEEVTDAFEVEQVMDPGHDYNQFIDLTFYSINGSDWHAFGVRVS